MLRADFPRLLDPEELYHEAWAELLDTRRRTKRPVENHRALLKKIAWRRATDLSRKHKPDYLDPASVVLATAADPTTPTDEQVEVRLEGDALRLVVESLDERQAAAIKLRIDADLSNREIQKRLGVSETRLEMIVTDAYKAVLRQLETTASGETVWKRHQRSLLLACEMGIASSRQRRDAREMVARDPQCAAMLRHLRSSLEDVAAALPLPVVVADNERHERLLGPISDGIDAARAGTRSLVQHLLARGGPTPGTTAGTPIGEVALGLGVGAKVVATCLAAGGAAALCVGGLVAPAQAPSRPTDSGVSVARSAPPVTPPAREQRPAAAVAPSKPSQSKPSQPAPRRKRAAVAKPKARAPVSSPAYVTPASPAPAGATEFGPGVVGSASAPTQPAPAPADGGGEFTP